MGLQEMGLSKGRAVVLLSGRAFWTNSFLCDPEISLGYLQRPPGPAQCISNLVEGPVHSAACLPDHRIGESRQMESTRLEFTECVMLLNRSLLEHVSSDAVLQEELDVSQAALTFIGQCSLVTHAKVRSTVFIHPRSPVSFLPHHVLQNTFVSAITSLPAHIQA